MLMDIAG